MENGYYEAKPDFRPWWLPLTPEGTRLITLSALPLVDGFFMVFLATGMWRDLWSDLAFGLTAFSGAGCVMAAMRLTGSVAQRLGQVALAYGLVVTGAILISTAQPFFLSILPPNLHLFTALFLFGLGLWISEVPLLQRIAGWTGFQAAVKAMLAASAMQGLVMGSGGSITFSLSLDLALLPALSVAVGAGLALSLAGAGVGLFLGSAVNSKSLNLGAATSLVAMSLSVLGLDVPSLLMGLPLVAGCLWTIRGMALQAITRKRTLTHRA